MAKAKGTTLIGTVKYLRKQREEALRALAPEFHHYLDERIQAHLWYPESDVLAVLRAMIELIGKPGPALFESIGRSVAREHEAGVYSSLLKVGPTTSGGFALWSAQHDTGEMVTTWLGTDAIQFDLIGYAYPSPEICGITEGYILELLKMSGIEATATSQSCARLGDDRCRWQLDLERGDSRPG